MAHVFLSYSREDIEIAKRLTEALEASGVAVWWDRTIPPGKTFDQVIEEALDDSSWAIVLWSEHSIASNWVKAEAEEALRRGILVPVLVADVRPPLAFRRIEAAELQDWDGDPSDPEFQQLLAVMGEAAPSPPAPRKPRPKPKPSPAPTPSRGMGLGVKLALGAAALVIAVLATLLVSRGDGGGPDSISIPGGDAGQTGDAEYLRDDPPAEAAREQRPPAKAEAEGQITASQPAAPPTPRTGTITLQYLGDTYGCQLLLQITVGSQTVAPQSSQIALQDVPLGAVSYSVGGTIGCPGIGLCNASGAGTLQVANGSIYNLIWQNTTPGGCGVTLVPG